MKWSWRIGRIFGIDLRIHATFPLLFAWIALSGLRGGATGRMILATLALTIAVFVVVVLHECGHAVVARRFGARTRDITLLPIGGIARLERMPREPRQELLIALAGPAVNVALAALLHAAMVLAGAPSARAELERAATTMTVTSVLAQAFAINVALAVFNMLPAFPMDGGRVLRALLVMRNHDHAKATATAARVGRAFAVVFAMAGIFLLESPMLALVAVFVWIAATSEALAAQTSAALEHVPLSGVMITDFRTLAPDDPLSKAVDLTIQGFQQDFPVAERGVLVGMLTHCDLLRGLSEHRRDATVSDVMQRELCPASPDDDAETAIERLAATRGAAVPVLHGHDLVGMVTAVNVAEFLSLQSAASSGASPSRNGRRLARNT